MFRFLCTLVLLLSLTLTLKAEQATVINDNVARASQRVELPHDADKFYLTIFGDTSTDEVKDMVTWFDTNDELKAVKSISHFNVIDSNTPMYKERYANSTPGLPCIRLQTSDRKKLVELSGNQIPITSDALAVAFVVESTSANPAVECFRKHRLGSTSATDQTPENQGLPFPWLICLFLAAVAGTLALVHELKSKFKHSKHNYKHK